MSQRYVNVSINDQSIDQTAEEELEALEDAERRKTEVIVLDSAKNSKFCNSDSIYILYRL